MTNGFRSVSRRRGTSLIWVALTLVLTAGMAALAVDLGRLYSVHARLQATADASALAGAAVLPRQSTARAVAREYADKNQPEATNGVVLADPDVVMGGWDFDLRSFVPDVEFPNAVKVTTRQAEANDNSVSLNFARAVGFESADVVTTAIAARMAMPAVIIILDPYQACALMVQGSVYIGAPGAGIHVNSEHPEAFCARGSVANTNSPLLSLVSPNQVETGNENWNAIMQRGNPYIEDPLASLPEPPWSPANDLGTIVGGESGEVVQAVPGYYSGGIDANGGTIELAPGVYVFGGAGVRLRGGVNLIADGVLIHLVGTGVLDMRSGGGVRITPPDPAQHAFFGAETYAGISVFQARNNTNTSSIFGNSMMHLEGRFYFPSAHLDLGGTGGGLVGNQFIANTMKIFGDGELMINYNTEPLLLGPPALVN